MLNGLWEDENTSIKISKNGKCMTMKFLPHIGDHMEARNKPCLFNVNHLIQNLKTNFQNATFRQGNPKWYNQSLKVTS